MRSSRCEPSVLLFHSAGCFDSVTHYRAGAFAYFLAAVVTFTFLRILNTALIKQELSHFIIDQFFLGYEAVMMSVRNDYNFCMRKSALEFGN